MEKRIDDVEKIATFNASFTDIFGVEHPNAVCMIATTSSNASADYAADGSLSHSTQSLSYRVCYWHSEEARAADAWPQEFLDKTGSNSFYFDGSSGAGATAVEECKQHFLSKVIAPAS